MTNAEKFKETFGFYPHDSCPLPNQVCESVDDCNKCPFDCFWDKEYKECFELKENKK